MSKVAFVLAWVTWVIQVWRATSFIEQQQSSSFAEGAWHSLSLEALATLFLAFDPSGAFHHVSCGSGAHVPKGKCIHWRFPASQTRYQPPVLRDVKLLPEKKISKAVEKEKHLLFDTAEITVQSGPGGHGEVITYSDCFAPKFGKVRSIIKIRRTEGGDYELPPGGGNGGDVVLFVDPAKSDLLHLRGRPKLVAQKGGHSQGLRDQNLAKHKWKDLANPSEVLDEEDIARGLHRDGVGIRSQMRIRDGDHLRVPVPPGTFVRTTKGRVLGDLVSPGQELRVAKGGQGGPCVMKDRPTVKRSRGRKKEAELEDALQLSDTELKELTFGEGPEEVKIELILRTVADVGFVGFPNAGKSTLLRALSRASPEVAPFPFTTLMPNLGVMTDEDQDEFAKPAKSAPLLADLPGLIEGAHAGKGLGRLFLRHLRRVRVILYIVDTSCQFGSVAEQYEGLRRELGLYNPRYLERPHIVALNKLDLAMEEGGEAGFTDARKAAAREIMRAAAQARNETAPPVAIVPISGMKGKGLKMLREAMDDALARVEEIDVTANTQKAHALA